MRWLAISLLCLLTACAGTGKGASFHQRIGFFRASQLASDYLVNRHLDWGQPTSTRIVEDYVVFFYSPGKQISKVEGRQASNRALYVDIHSGEVTSARM